LLAIDDHYVCMSEAPGERLSTFGLDTRVVLLWNSWWILKEHLTARSMALLLAKYGFYLACFLYTKLTRGKAVCVKTPPPPDDNLSYHILRAQYQNMIQKAADQLTPPTVDIAAYRWEFNCQWDRVCTNSTHCKRISSPTTLADVINCHCKSVGKACSSHAWSCHSAGLSRTQYVLLLNRWSN